MTLRLNGSTSGYVEIDAPATAGSNTLVLPTGNGTNGQYLQTNGSGSLSWATVTPALFESYAIINDTKSSSSNGGTFLAGGWRTRDLNTEVDDPDGIVSIASNQFTLGAGSYLIRWSAPAWRVDGHNTRLYNVTNATAEALGSTGYTAGSGVTHSFSSGADRVTITGNTVFEIQHRCLNTNVTTGFGLGQGGGSTWGDNIFTIVEIFREA